MANTQKLFAQSVGVVLILLGIIGFFNKPLLGLFGVNSLHNVVHILVGVIALWMVSKGSSQAFNKYLGMGGIVLGVLGFIPGVKDLLLEILAINTSTTWLHLLIGVLGVGVAYGVKEAAGVESAPPEEKPAEEPPAQ